jgi:hypothetical protein
VVRPTGKKDHANSDISAARDSLLLHLRPSWSPPRRSTPLRTAFAVTSGQPGQQSAARQTRHILFFFLKNGIFNLSSLLIYLWSTGRRWRTWRPPQSSVNVRLSVVRKLVAEARQNGLIGVEEAASLSEVPNIRQKGNSGGELADEGAGLGTTGCFRSVEREG